MSLVLDAIAAGAADRAAVIRWLFSVRERDFRLGRYSIDRHRDTTRRSYGIYRVRSGLFFWAGAVQAPE
jgi:hypothetical protein